MTRQKGFKHSKETKRKIGLANAIALKGHHPKCEFKKGCIPWNKGKKLLYNPHLKKRGQTPWNKGKINKIEFQCIKCNIIIYSYTKRKYCSHKCMFADSNRKTGFVKGHGDLRTKEYIKSTKGKKCPEHSKKLLKFWENNPNTKKQISQKIKLLYKNEPERIEKLREYRKNQKNVYVSKHELLFKTFLEKNKIKFIHQKFINDIPHSYKCDFFISPNIIVEVDGEYWHSFEETKIKDLLRTKELLNNGFKVIRIKDNEIYNSNYVPQLEQINKRIIEIQNAINK